jgi:serine/threonine protein kinase/TolB-like protein
MIGETVSHYRIVGKLGGGGMGVIYEAEDLRLGRRVALKFIPENLLSDKKSLERFEREARSASQLNHPNICTIHDIEDNNGHPFIVMEKLDGESLKERLRGKALDLDSLLDVALNTAEALIASHAKGIIHRDIKPANIFLTTTGQVKILDFGLAKMARGQAGTETDTPVEDSLTAVGVIPGTAVYMSPEQARGEHLDPRSDIFSFGVVLYEMATGKKPFAGTNVVTTLDAVLHQKPAPPTNVNPNVPRELELIIGKAMEKDRTKRYASVAEMKSDLQHLRRETESGLVKTAAQASAPLRIVTKTFQSSSRVTLYALLGVTALLITILAAFGAWYFKRRAAANAAPVRLNTIAVLPLRNMNGDANFDYLRFALADELSNALTYTHFLEIRPASSTQKFTGNDVDPQKAGKELRVANVLTGHFLEQGSTLLVTLEAITVADDRLIWQTNVTEPSGDLIALQSALDRKVRTELLPAMGASGTSSDTSTYPTNQAAYDLYLRSNPMSHDPGPNRDAIDMLEKAVAMDPFYAPAWEVLGRRYYFDAVYGNGGEASYQKSSAALQRAMSLEPSRISAAGYLYQIMVEHGDLTHAYADAVDLVRRRPEAAMSHFTLAYILRYAGLLEEAQKECDLAMGIDPTNFNFRSCSFAFFEDGKDQRALDYLRVDADSEFSKATTVGVLLRDGRVAEAKLAAERMTDNPAFMKPLLTACLNRAPAAEIDKLAAEAETKLLPAERDSELKYWQAGILAYCGRPEPAFKFLHKAIEENYCAHTALQHDPMLTSLRGSPAFNKLLSESSQCEQKFLTSRPK